MLLSLLSPSYVMLVEAAYHLIKLVQIDTADKVTRVTEFHYHVWNQVHRLGTELIPTYLAVTGKKLKNTS